MWESWFFAATSSTDRLIRAYSYPARKGLTVSKRFRALPLTDSKTWTAKPCLEHSTQRHFINFISSNHFNIMYIMQSSIRNTLLQHALPNLTLRSWLWTSNRLTLSQIQLSVVGHKLCIDLCSLSNQTLHSWSRAPKRLVLSFTSDSP